MNDDRCATTHGTYRCERPRGHEGNCESADHSRVAIPLGPYRDTLRTVAYVRGAIDFGIGDVLDLVGRYLGCERTAGEDDCRYRARLAGALP